MEFPALITADAGLYNSKARDSITHDMTMYKRKHDI
jgi:hypothetical protein